VAIDWPGVGCGPLDPPSPGSVEGILHDLGEEALLVDLAFPGTSSPLLVPGQPYEITGATMVPRRAYDALVYLERSRAMTPLQWTPCAAAR
jgi:hypothetical protein